MRKILLGVLSLFTFAAFAQTVEVQSPDEKLQMLIGCDDNGAPQYTVQYDGRTLLEASPLGLITDYADLSRGLTMTEYTVEAQNRDSVQILDNSKIKTGKIIRHANTLRCTFATADKHILEIEFYVSNNDIAFRYLLPQPEGRGSTRVMGEATGFRFPPQTTTFLTPQSDAMIGWKRTKPSYEEEYRLDQPLGEKSQYGHGYTFPGLFRVGDNGWVLLSETGVDDTYCASRLSDFHDGVYTIAYPMPEENNGNGTVEPGIALPGTTPWRTITVGSTLRPIVETTIPWQVTEQKLETRHDYKFGRGVWSWILWQDGSINYDDQVRYIDFAAEMKYEYALIDNWWDTRIGKERMEELIRYAHSKGVDIFLWYSSSGYWNDIVQGPINKMSNSETRKNEMRWMSRMGVKGIKVDFFGGDKQETMRLYHDILSDANDYGLMVIFHGCTLPRGWETMYPNYVGSEAVLASENLIFDQHHCDVEARNACLHPFIRNAVGCMEFGGVFLNRRLHRSNAKGTIRRTTDLFQLATAVLFQNPIQNFALAPNNLTDAPAICIDFMRSVPTVWDETRLIDGYPGKYIVLARRHGDTWYVAAVNAEAEPRKLTLDLSILQDKNIRLYSGGNEPDVSAVKLKKNGRYNITLQPQDGIVIVAE